MIAGDQTMSVTRNNLRLILRLSILACALLLGQASITVLPATWAKKAVSLEVQCDSASPATQRITAPDRTTAAHIRCRKLTRDDEALVLQVTQGDRRMREIVIQTADELWRPQELLWAPDSRAFAINGSPSAYAGSSFIAYILAGDSVRPVEPTAAAQRDMVRSFPPCKATNLAERECQEFEKSPQYNMSVIDWTHDGSSIVVFGEIPCSSRYGGIMCQVMGYELDLPTGRILRRIDAPSMKREFQEKMAWPMKIPESPNYK